MMYSDYLIEQNKLTGTLIKAENNLLRSDKFKFQTTHNWRKEVVPDFPGVYALFENQDSLLYIGETGNLRERMSDICRTVNHTFRRQLACKRFGATKTSKKFDPDIELILDAFFEEKLHVSFIRVNFGRMEIEEFLVAKYQKILLNSEKKRKLKIALDELEDNEKGM